MISIDGQPALPDRLTLCLSGSVSVSTVYLMIIILIVLLP